jgi:hypothetical protein
MTPEDFRTMLIQNTDAQLLEPCLLNEQTPYVFETIPDTWNLFRAALTTRLSVAPEDIRVIGSGRFGFSLKPWNNLRAFSDRSDIDVLIVNPNLFDELWLALLGAAYPRGPLARKLGGWLRKRRNELYTGWLTPLAFRLDLTIVGARGRPVVDFNSRWFTAMKEAGRHPTKRHEDIKGRLYRTWRHAELYHLNSLAELRRTLAL